jgi:predicted dehydrogenase
MLNWLVIGIGDITRKRVLPAVLAQPRSRLYALLTRSPAKAAAYPGALVFTDLGDALRDPAIDAVYVASPVALHAEHTITSLRAGKHVLCEKPVALNFAQAESMAEAARQSGRLLGVAYYRRLYPKLVRAKELIAESAIGQPVLVEANYHGWLESPDRAWLKDPAIAGGGPLYDVGSHRIDACNFLFGRPLRATGLLSNAVHELAVEDSATALVEYAGGIHAVIDVRWNSRMPRDQFRVIGSEGEISLDPLNGPTLRLLASDGRLTEEQLPPHANVHYPAAENFVAAVLDGAPLACPIGEAIWTDWVTEQVKGAQ